MVLRGRPPILEGDVILVLANESKSTFRCMLSRSAHLEDDIETLLRRCPAEDTPRHRFANIRRSRTEARHGGREPRSTTSAHALKLAHVGVPE